MNKKQRTIKNWQVNLILLVISVIVALGIGEIILRWRYPYAGFQAGTELPWMRKNSLDFTEIFTIDPEIGFHPILGKTYTQYGTLPNKYSLAKSPNVTRILFIGDSVTSRGRIVNALKQRYDDERFEYWNAGVESFNTVQEVQFYSKYNAEIEPDHVVLTFHLNDFETTPVAFFNQEKQFVVYAPHTPLRPINRKLFETSYIYRLFIGLSLNQNKGKQAIIHEMRASLRTLRDTLRQHNIQFSVLVLPLLKPYAEWGKDDKERRETILNILQTLDIRFFDLFPPCEHAIQSGVEVQETSGDTWHPNAQVAKIFADYLFQHQFLINATQ